MNWFLAGVWTGAIAMTLAWQWQVKRARERLLAACAKAEGERATLAVTFDQRTQTIRVGRARYSAEFLAEFPQARGHFRMTGPVALPDGGVTCEIHDTTPLVRGAAAHLAAAQQAEPVAARELVGKALALLDLMDAEVRAKELLDGKEA